MIYDISRTISTRIAVWPGDSPFQFEHNLELGKGDSINLTTITLSPHTGSHADAPYHYEANGLHPHQLPLNAFLGPATVVQTTKTDGPLYPEDFAHYHLENVERLLIHSHVSDLPDDAWPAEFPYLSIELIDWLAERNVVLIGLDSPSVDAFDSTELPCHHELYRRNIVNLEILNLKDVPDGDYELIALPLKMDHVCGAPVRAILRTLPTDR